MKFGHNLIDHSHNLVVYLVRELCLSRRALEVKVYFFSFAGAEELETRAVNDTQ